MSNVFVDRLEELALLEDAYGKRPGLVVVYGRRRVGKTRLVVEWLKKSVSGKGVYYHAIPASHSVNLRDFAHSIASQLGIPVFEKLVFRSLDVLLETLASFKKDVVVVIDEFTYWVRGEPRVVGELQRFVDHRLQETRMLIVVVGSLLGVMMGSVLGGGSPLYGRARLKLKVEPLEPWYIPKIHSWLSIEDCVRLYALFGGIPYYHFQVPRGAKLREVLEKIVFSPATPLRDEVFFMIRDELQNPAPYMSILEAVAQGKTRVSEISNSTGIPVQHLSKYLSTLELLGFVERVRPLDSKKGWYRVRDAPTRTWLKLVRPLTPLIEAGEIERAIRNALPVLEQLAGEVFEEIAEKYVAWLARKKRISYTRIGRWSRKGVEIDILAVDDENKVVHAFEVKWSDLDERAAKRIARDLDRKLDKTPYSNWVRRLHVVARSYQGQDPGVEMHTLRKMPFCVTGHQYC